MVSSIENDKIILFDSKMEPISPPWIRVDLGAMAIKEYFTFSKAPRQEPHHQMSYPRHTKWKRGSYPSSEIQSYSTAPADWAERE